MIVGDLAAATGLSVRALRHWEVVGLLTASRDSAGHRRYVTDDLTRVAQAVVVAAQDRSDQASWGHGRDLGESGFVPSACNVASQARPLANRSGPPS